MLKYDYDAVGNRTKVIDPWNRVIAYQYDGANRLAQVTDPQTKVTSYTYNKVGAPVEVNYPNGVKTTNSYDSLNRLTMLKAQGSVLINQFAYSYDNVGNRLTMTDKDGGVTRYEYDKLYRLTKASYPSTSATTYTYDPVGNRLTMNGVGYSYDVADRLLQAGATTYGYDANGNMVSKTDAGVTTNYAYDYANRLTLISLPSSPLPHLSSFIAYKYDGYGRRVSQLVKGGGFGIPESQYTEYLWDGTNVMLEFYQNKGNPLEYVYGNGQMISRDDLLVLPVSKNLVYQNSHWFHQDGLGSVVNLTDSGGNTKLSYGYDAFGEITKEEGQVGWKKNRYTFTGKPYDPSAGMYYFGARWYDSEVGRFITKDLWTSGPDDARILTVPTQYRRTVVSNSVLINGLNTPSLLQRYVYVGNNPINRIDPLGLWYIDINFWIYYPYGFGFTGGFIFGGEGIYTYMGGGVGLSPAGFAITIAPMDEPTPGWNVAEQAGWGIGQQMGYGFGEGGDEFWEVGFMMPGASLTGYYVEEVAKWPWIKKTKKK